MTTEQKESAQREELSEVLRDIEAECARLNAKLRAVMTEYQRNAITEQHEYPFGLTDGLEAAETAALELRANPQWMKNN